MGFGNDESAVRRSCGVRLALPVNDGEAAGERSQELYRHAKQTTVVGSGSVLGGACVDVVA